MSSVNLYAYCDVSSSATLPDRCLQCRLYRGNKLHDYCNVSPSFQPPTCYHTPSTSQSTSFGQSIKTFDNTEKPYDKYHDASYTTSNPPIHLERTLIKY
jgi:hypothetical protein